MTALMMPHDDAGENGAPDIHFNAGKEVDGKNDHDGVDNDGRKTHS